MFELHRENPYRPPDFRWQVAGIHVNQRRRITRRFNDEDVVTAIRFRRLLEGCRNGWDHAQLLDIDEAGTSAWNIYRTKPPTGDNTFRWELESWLLTDQPYEDIAKRMALSTATIDRYERWFFSVRSSLISDAYVTHSILYPAAQRSGRMRTAEALWKSAAYRGGEAALVMLVHHCRAKEATGEDFLKLQIRRRMLDLTTRATATMLPDITTYQLILESYFKICDLDQATGATAQGSLVQNIMTFCNNLSWGNASLRGTQTSDSLPMLPNGATLQSSELANWEQLRQDSPYLSLIESAKFPNTSISE